MPYAIWPVSVVLLMLISLTSVLPAQANNSITSLPELRESSRAFHQDQSMPETFNLLFMGNSHSASHNLPQLVATLLKLRFPDINVNAQLAPGYHFLDERLKHSASNRLFNSAKWTHVILQAQKYSTTGRYFYPTDSAEEWIRRVNAKKAQAIMFPEWPRRGNTEEGQRIHQLHQGIAKAEPACVAPIGLAWEQAIKSNPRLKLHASDGNHASLEGTFLTALILYGAISGEDPSELPEISQAKVPSKLQAELKQAASIALQQNAPCPL